MEPFSIADQTGEQTAQGQEGTDAVVWLFQSDGNWSRVNDDDAIKLEKEYAKEGQEAYIENILERDGVYYVDFRLWTIKDLNAAWNKRLFRGTRVQARERLGWFEVQEESPPVPPSDVPPIQQSEVAPDVQETDVSTPSTLPCDTARPCSSSVPPMSLDSSAVTLPQPQVGSSRSDFCEGKRSEQDDQPRGVEKSGKAPQLASRSAALPLEDCPARFPSLATALQRAHEVRQCHPPPSDEHVVAVRLVADACRQCHMSYIDEQLRECASLLEARGRWGVGEPTATIDRCEAILRVLQNDIDYSSLVQQAIHAPRTSKHMVVVLNCIGEAQGVANNPTVQLDAHRHALLSLECASVQPPYPALVSTMLLLANAYGSFHQYEVQETLLRKAICTAEGEIRRGSDSCFGMVRPLVALADMFAARFEFSQEMQHLRQALDCCMAAQRGTPAAQLETWTALIRKRLQKREF